MRYFFTLVSHPKLSAAEVLRVLRQERFTPTVVVASSDFLLLELAQSLSDDFLTRLGGTSRIGVVVAQQEHQYEAEEVARLLSPIDKKIHIGLSAVGIPGSYAKTLSVALKKALRARGVRMRFIVPKGRSDRLNAAQVLFNKLHRDPHQELTFIHHDGMYYVARTIQVQDIQAYELRDTRRPVRKMHVGMLPPKVAQLMINLVPYTVDQPTVYDPFCGSGTVLQEGWLMGYSMVGSDLHPAMIDTTQRNLGWLGEHFTLDSTRRPTVFLHDVRKPFPKELDGRVDAIVTEPYLGKPLSSPLSPTVVGNCMKELGGLYSSFFRSALPILKIHGYILFLIPAFRQSRRRKGFWLFPESFLDEISTLGYRREQLVPAGLLRWYPTGERQTILYARPDALVGREFTLWQKQ